MKNSLWQEKWDEMLEEIYEPTLDLADIQEKLQSFITFDLPNYSQILQNRSMEKGRRDLRDNPEVQKYWNCMRLFVQFMKSILNDPTVLSLYKRNREIISTLETMDQGDQGFSNLENERLSNVKMIEKNLAGAKKLIVDNFGSIKSQLLRFVKPYLRGQDPNEIKKADSYIVQMLFMIKKHDPNLYQRIISQSSLVDKYRQHFNVRSDDRFLVKPAIKRTTNRVKPFRQQSKAKTGSENIQSLDDIKMDFLKENESWEDRWEDFLYGD